MYQQPLNLGEDELRMKLLSLGCELTQVTTLKVHPGSVHWHIKKHGAKTGTLEATWLPNGEAWLSYNANRYQPWIEEVIEALK